MKAPLWYLLACALTLGCDRPASKAAPLASGVARASTSAAPAPPFVPLKVEIKDTAMGTALHFIAYTSPRADEPAARAAVTKAIAEMRRLEALMSEWKSDSEIGKVNQRPGQWQDVSAETYEVLEKSVWAGKLSHATFDITFQAMGGLWKFGSAQDTNPKPPSRTEIEQKRLLIDYRKVELDAARHAVRIGPDQQIGLGGVAKGYIVDRAARVLREAGLQAFLVQAGGDLYGAGSKPDGSRWVSGVQDPRGPQGKFFAMLELEDHAFSTAGDYARSYVVAGKRYHHIIDPRTGYPAGACRSVTIWAPDATTADVVDDAIFILGPEQGLELVEGLEGVGAVIVDARNKVWISKRLEGRVKLLSEPTDGI
ncbi:MAG TPA: FAD:protein FMN transferase [Polyangiaceae bacterium]|nr:FAD:protein FMN transferase [Polyangiaceae bacterium]